MRSIKHLKLIALTVFPILGGLIAYVYYPTSKQIDPIPMQDLNPPSTSAQESLLGSNKNIKSPGITLLPYSSELVEEFDIGFQKWILIFENLKNRALDSCEMMRTFSLTPEDIGEFISEQDYMKGKSSFSDKMPAIKNTSGTFTKLPHNKHISIVSAKGFLPGEKITFRAKASGSTHYDTISFYPRPIVLCDAKGEELASAELVSTDPTIYMIHFTFNSKNPFVRFYSDSGKEHLDSFVLQDGPTSLSYCPGTRTGKGGVSSFHWTYLNGDTYEFAFPWGNELNLYMLGLK